MPCMSIHPKTSSQKGYTPPLCGLHLSVTQFATAVQLELIQALFCSRQYVICAAEHVCECVSTLYASLSLNVHICICMDVEWTRPIGK